MQIFFKIPKKKFFLILKIIYYSKKPPMVSEVKASLGDHVSLLDVGLAKVSTIVLSMHYQIVMFAILSVLNSGWMIIALFWVTIVLLIVCLLIQISKQRKL